ncbi:MAG TPA: DoxX family membrane protein [Acetobacteraceae bacterium]|nr:DoxX family membrane protein [Acetobacteraceae bacterium]
MALGVVCLASRNFILSQLLPDNFSHRIALAYVGAAFTLVAGAAIEWRRAMPWAAAALTVFYALIVLIAIDVHFMFVNYAEYGTYSNVAEELAITAAALILAAGSLKIAAAWAQRLTRLGQVIFGVCAVLFGGAHFFYVNLTVPLVPKFLPPSQEFWAYATGIFHIAGGIAIITGVRARLAAILLTAMYASFTPLVHLPLLFGSPTNHFYWSENAINLALTGAAWVVADSLRRRWMLT